MKWSSILLVTAALLAPAPAHADIAPKKGGCGVGSSSETMLAGAMLAVGAAALLVDRRRRRP